MGTSVTTSVISNGRGPRHGEYVHIFVLFLSSSGLPLPLPLPEGSSEKTKQTRSWNLPLSSLPKAGRSCRGLRGPSPASGSLRTCPGGLPLAVGLLSPPRPLGRLPAQLVVCKGLDQRETSSDHRGTERSKWFKQASRRLGLYPLLFQPRDMCFSGNSGNYLCPLRKGRVFSACVWGF